MDPLFYETTRVGEVLSRLTTDTTLVASHSGVNLSIILRSSFELGRRADHARAHQRDTHGHHAGADSRGGRPSHRHWQASSRIVTRVSGSHCRHHGLAGETLNAIQTVQAFTLEDLQSERYRKAVEDSFLTAVRRTRVRAALTAVGITLVFAGITFVLWLALHQVLAGTMTEGSYYSFCYTPAFVGSSRRAHRNVGRDAARSGAMERLSELLEARPTIGAPPHPSIYRRELPAPYVRECHVSLPIAPGSAALANFSLDVRRGETIAFVGPSEPARAQRFSCCCASTTRIPAGS